MTYEQTSDNTYVPSLLKAPVPEAPEGKVPIRILVCGVPEGVNSIVQELHVKGFAEGELGGAYKGRFFTNRRASTLIKYKSQSILSLFILKIRKKLSLSPYFPISPSNKTVKCKKPTFMRLGREGAIALWICL